MIKTGVPAALVKCLYLFVTLPPRKVNCNSPDDVEEEVKCSFQDTLTQVFTVHVVLVFTLFIGVLKHAFHSPVS